MTVIVTLFAGSGAGLMGYGLANRWLLSLGIAVLLSPYLIVLGYLTLS